MTPLDVPGGSQKNASYLSMRLSGMPFLKSTFTVSTLDPASVQKRLILANSSSSISTTVSFQSVQTDKSGLVMSSSPRNKTQQRGGRSFIILITRRSKVPASQKPCPNSGLGLPLIESKRNSCSC